MRLSIAAVVMLVALSGGAEARQHRHHHRHHHHAVSGTVLGGRPAGCPHAFCGCGASLYLFGKIIPALNLAANWPRLFPRAAPAPLMAAARPGHVFVLLKQVAGDMWLVHDANSGHHLTREHVRSIRGFRIVNPHA